MSELRFRVLIATASVEVLRRPFESTFYALISWMSYAADVGLLSDGAAEFGGLWMNLTYARIGNLEYGTERFPVAAEGVPLESVVALTVFPNPSSGDATVQFALDRPQRVTLAIFDVLGRRVLSEDLGVQSAGEATYRLDVAKLPAGLYVVRLDGDAGARATARIIRH